MRVLDLFAGIGGFTLGLERAGFETVAFCEIEPYAQKVLNKNWPGVKLYDDVRGITAERLATDGIGVDVITGGFPCQDISVAGKGAGIEGERSGLWSECARLIRELRPRYAIFENVTNLLNGERGDWFKRVLGDISALGYDAEWHCIPASSIGAHHHRDRVWIVAYPTGSRVQACGANRVGDDNRSRGDKGQSSGASEQEIILAYPNGNDGRRGDCTQSLGRESRLESRCSGEGQSVAGASEDVADPDESRLQRWLQDGIAYQAGRKVASYGSTPECGTRWERYRDGYWATEPDVGRVANGVSSRSHRLKCLGNAVVPQIPELIGRAIMEAENDYHRV